MDMDTGPLDTVTTGRRITGRPLESGSVTGGVVTDGAVVTVPSSTGTFIVAITGADNAGAERSCPS